MRCQGSYSDGVGRPSVPPGRYFRMLFVGQYEGLDSEREIAWRCADSLSLHRFLRLSEGETVPDHTTLSVTRSRLPIEIHHAVFGFVLESVERHDLVRGRRIGVDASTQEANAALRRLVRRDTGEDYRQMLERLAKDSGIEAPSTEDLIRFDRTRKGKSLSNAEWASPTDPEARIAKMKDGTTHLAYKPEHAVDLDTRPWRSTISSTKPKTAWWISIGRRERVTLSVVWSGTVSPSLRRRNRCSDRESAHRHAISRSEPSPSYWPTNSIRKYRPGGTEGRPTPSL